VCLVEPAPQPPDGIARAALSIPERDQGGQFERLGQVEWAGIAGFDLSGDEVAPLEGPP
jgi:hypothetical protein